MKGAEEAVAAAEAASVAAASVAAASVAAEEAAAAAAVLAGVVAIAAAHRLPTATPPEVGRADAHVGRFKLDERAHHRVEPSPCLGGGR